MVPLPHSTVTFLFTDIEGSTRLLQQLGARYAGLLADHHRLLRVAFGERGGIEVQDHGDGFYYTFHSAKTALAAAVAAQRAVRSHPWPEGASVRVRMGLHTGEALSGETGYVGLDIHRAARMCTAGHGGQMLLSQTTRDLAEDDLPEGVNLRDLGEHRLKDLTRPQRLFQVVVPDLPGDFPPLRSLDALPNNLPLQLTSFIGREREKAEVKRLLSTARLVTLTGSGGAGKTRLALQVAAEVLEEFKDGAWVVELASVFDPALVPKAVASALNVPEQPGRLLTETLVDYLRSRSVLLAPDNCEHLLQACARLADALLRSCPNLRILATSREALHIEGETTYRVPSLSVPDAVTLPLERLADFEAVRLFIDRATAALPAFVIVAQNAREVVDICQRLDGIPLAIELAAARVRALPVEQISRRLHDRFALLTGGSRTALPRQQTLRAAIDWSYDLLSEPERVLLRRLSVFAGGFPLEAAEAVCQGQDVNADEVVDLLTHLVEKSLVVFQEREGRYRLLETVRQYARDKLLESGEGAEVRQRHRDWYLALAERTEPELLGREPRTCLDWLEAEHDNLRAALEWSNTEPGGAEAGLRLAGALFFFWFMRGHWSEARGRLEDALARDSDVSVPITWKALRAAAYFAWRQGDDARATTLSEKGLLLCREQGDNGGVGTFLLILGLVAISQRDYERAKGLFEESLILYRGVGDKWSISSTITQLGIVANAVGDYERAAALVTDSLTLSRELGYTWLTTFSLRILGSVTLHLENYAQAEALFRESMALAREIGDRWNPEACLSGLAGVACVRGHYAHAARLLAAAESLGQTLGTRRPAHIQADHDQRVVSARAGLGDEAFAAAWAEGRAMPLERTIEYALNENV